MRRYLYVTAALVCIAAAVGGCRPKRPYGVERLGPLKDFIGAETYLERQNLLVRDEDGGLSCMSTMCTYDLSPLVLRRTAEGCELISRFSHSRYDCRGKVLSGPAKYDLPYYELFAAPGEYEGRIPDTLYVWISKEKPPSWRLRYERHLEVK